MDADIAWAAGFFEGEGYLGHAAYTRGKRAGARAGITHTDLDVLERFMLTVEMGRITKRGMRPGTTKEQYVWNITDKASVHELIELFYPWLGKRRKERADELLQLREDGRIRRGPAKRKAVKR